MCSLQFTNTNIETLTFQDVKLIIRKLHNARAFVLPKLPATFKELQYCMAYVLTIFNLKQIQMKYDCSKLRLWYILYIQNIYFSMPL